ncbi:unnamed protein product [Prunus armeniaca]|uniref:Uncharacterized protein n=1 Tax=Prunus armeniaca TaxID=36596 RepID=A0A6J5X3Y6_PRUAR|nr:unnamed protein product [Prunus armeniaca]
MMRSFIPTMIVFNNNNNNNNHVDQNNNNNHGRAMQPPELPLGLEGPSWAMDSHGWDMGKMVEEEKGGRGWEEMRG